MEVLTALRLQNPISGIEKIRQVPFRAMGRSFSCSKSELSGQGFKTDSLSNPVIDESGSRDPGLFVISFLWYKKRN